MHAATQVQGLEDPPIEKESPVTEAETNQVDPSGQSQVAGPSGQSEIADSPSRSEVVDCSPLRCDDQEANPLPSQEHQPNAGRRLIK